MDKLARATEPQRRVRLDVRVDIVSVLESGLFIFQSQINHYYRIPKVIIK